MDPPTEHGAANNSQPLSAALSYLLPVLAVLLVAGGLGWRATRFGSVRRHLPALLAQGAVIVDVRTPVEFAAGSCKGSINIPLAELEKRAGGMDRGKPVVVCCVSGARSATAAAILKRKGFAQVLNAGSWTNTVV